MGQNEVSRVQKKEYEQQEADGLISVGSFKFDGHKFVMQYTMYLIEHLESKIK